MPSLPDSYERSRERFRARLDSIRQRWPDCRLTSISYPWQDDLTTDVLQADSSAAKERLIVLSTGLHGIEGYFGSAVLELFFEEYLNRLDPRTTGLLLVHAINPWGMKHWRRANPENVDLNRNFIEGGFSSLLRFNADYPALSPFLNPQRPLGNLWVEKIRFAAQTVQKLLTFGPRRIREAALMGQYHQPEGIYFGGAALQPETKAMMELYRSAFAGYRQIIHLDMHTGYGPRDQMTLVISPHEKMTVTEITARYGTPRVAAANPDEFYTMKGDMTDWEYQMVEKEFPGANFFGAACEFGTFGDSILQGARSLRITVFKNQLNQHGASAKTAAWVENEYRELYLPTEAAWFEKAMSDARQTFNGIFDFGLRHQ
jgi:predicted deacylase